MEFLSGCVLDYCVKFRLIWLKNLCNEGLYVVGYIFHSNNDFQLSDTFTNKVFSSVLYGTSFYVAYIVSFKTKIMIYYLEKSLDNIGVLFHSKIFLAKREKPNISMTFSLKLLSSSRK